MALGIVSDDEFNELLNELSNKKTVIIQRNDEPSVVNEPLVISKEIKHGRGIDKKNVPSSVRALVASEAISGCDVKELSEEFNVSLSSISAYKKGATSTSSYNEPDVELDLANKLVRNGIVGSAQKALLDAISMITVEKLSQVKVNVASQVAMNMSSVVRNISPSNEGGSNNNNKVIIYRPRMREEDDYDVIQVSD